jgi:hypothetical protein
MQRAGELKPGSNQHSPDESNGTNQKNCSGLVTGTGCGKFDTDIAGVHFTDELTNYRKQVTVSRGGRKGRPGFGA